jgi:hypothetical protein
MQCSNNLKQVSLATHTFAGSNDGIIPADTYCGNPTCTDNDHEKNGLHKYRGKGWTQYSGAFRGPSLYFAIAPYLELTAVHDACLAFDPASGGTNPRQSGKISVFLCPSMSDDHQQTYIEGSAPNNILFCVGSFQTQSHTALKWSEHYSDDYGKGGYFFPYGSGDPRTFDYKPDNPGWSWWACANWGNKTENPILVSDGTSNTMIYAEGSSGDNYKRRGNEGAAIPALLFGEINNDASGRPWCHTSCKPTSAKTAVDSGSIYRHDHNTAQPGEESREGSSTAWSANSLHTAGVNVGMGDGSSRFVSFNIDRFVWSAIGTCDAGEIETAP